MSRVGKRGLGRGTVVAVRRRTVRAFLNLGETLALHPTQLCIRIHLDKLCEYTYLLIHFHQGLMHRHSQMQNAGMSVRVGDSVMGRREDSFHEAL